MSQNGTINNRDIRNARDAANKSQRAYLGAYNLGTCIAIPFTHPQAGVYLFPGRDISVFHHVDLGDLERVVDMIENQPGTLKTLISESKVYMKEEVQ